jgi:hypothetical protein
MNIYGQTKFGITGRAFVVKSTLPSAPVELVLNSQHPILKDFNIQLSPTTILPKDFGFKILIAGLQIYPVIGSADVGAAFAGINAGWAAIPTNQIFYSDDLDYIVPGPPYDIKFQFYNADAANDGYVFIWARVCPKVDLTPLPVTDDKGKYIPISPLTDDEIKKMQDAQAQGIDLLGIGLNK